MKQFVKFMSLAAGTLCLVLLPKATALDASAATYQVRNTSSGWHYIEGEEWSDDDQGGREVYYLNNGILQDGDTVVINAPKENVDAQELTLSKSLANLTVRPGVNVVVHVPSVTTCVVCYDSTGVVNGYVSNAYVYNNGVGQFNGNVGNLYVLSDEATIEAQVACTGTVGYLQTDCKGGSLHEYYNFKAGTLEIKSGRLQTNESNYSETPSTVSSSAAASAATTTTASAAAVGEYDDVPKTAEAPSAVLPLLGVAFAALGGSLLLRKRASR